MKRVIEIDEKTDTILKCTPLDDVLDKIEDDVRKLITVEIEDGSDGYDTMVDLNEVIGILRSYKESEDA